MNAGPTIEDDADPDDADPDDADPDDADPDDADPDDAVRLFVSRYCRSRLGTLVEAADRITEEVCQAVADAVASGVVTGRSFRSFAYRIAALRVDEVLRSAGRSRTHLAAEGPADLLAELLCDLPAFQREALLLRIAVGLTVEQTAHAVGATPDAVRLAQHLALVRLRGAVAERAG